MKRIVAIGTALLIFCQGINLQFKDLVELDILVEHYQFHVQAHGDDLISFLSKHYGKEKDSHNLAHQEEQQQHEKLPFQQQSQGHQPLVLPFGQAHLLQTRNEPPGDSNVNFHYQDNYSTLLGERHFQPPRHA